MRGAGSSAVGARWSNREGAARSCVAARNQAPSQPSVFPPGGRRLLKGNRRPCMRWCERAASLSTRFHHATTCPPSRRNVPALPLHLHRSPLSAAQGWLAYAQGKFPGGTRITFIEAYWKVGATPRQSNSFYCEWCRRSGPGGSGGHPPAAAWDVPVREMVNFAPLLDLIAPGF